MDEEGSASVLGELSLQGLEQVASRLGSLGNLQNVVVSALTVQEVSKGPVVLTSLEEVLNHLNTSHRLFNLRFDRCHCTPDKLKAFATGLCNHRTLQSFTVEGGNTGAEGCRALIGLAESCPSLKKLELLSCGINSSEAGFALAQIIEVTTSLMHIISVERFGGMGVEGAVAIGQALASNITLETLCIEGHQVRDAGTESIGRALAAHQTLCRLELPRNEIGDLGAKAIAQGIELNQKLQTLVLTHNRIGDEGAVEISNAFAKHQTLRVLDLSHNIIGDRGAKALGLAIEGNTVVQDLSLKGMKIGDEGADVIGTGLGKNHTLTHLNLQDNQIGDDGARGLSRGIAGNESLQVLNLKANKIAAEGGRAFGNALSRNSSLQVLFLGENNISDEGAAYVAQGLTQNTSLLQLDLGENNIGDHGAQALGQAFENNRTLREITLWYNNVGVEGVKALVRFQHSLQVLELGNNPRIGDEGVKIIAQSMDHLKSLDLFNVSFGDEGAKALAQALQHNTNLEHLFMNNNTIRDAGALALAAALQDNKHLQQLGLGSKYLGYNGLRSLADLMERNQYLTGDFEFVGMGMFADPSREDEFEDLASIMETHFSYNAELRKERLLLEQAEQLLGEIEYAVLICRSIPLPVGKLLPPMPFQPLPFLPYHPSTSSLDSNGDFDTSVASQIKQSAIRDLQNRTAFAKIEARRLASKIPLLGPFLIDVNDIETSSGSSAKRRRRDN